MSTGTGNRKLAYEIAIRRLRELQFGPKPPRLSTLLVRYLQDYAAFRKKSAWRDEIACRNLIRLLSPELAINGNATAAVNIYVSKRIKEVSAPTVNRELAILAKACRCAIEWGQLKPSDLPTITKIDERDRPHGRALTPVEIAALLKSCSRWLKPIVLTLLATGMRRSELINLDWQDIDDSARIARINKTKAGKPQIVPLPPWLRRGKRTNGPVFTHGGRRLKAGGKLRDDWEAAKKKALLPDVRMHDLRHTFCTAIGSLTDARTLQILARHSSIKTTERYWHPVSGAAQKAVNVWVAQLGHKKGPGTKA